MTKSSQEMTDYELNKLAFLKSVITEYEKLQDQYDDEDSDVNEYLEAEHKLLAGMFWHFELNEGAGLSGRFHKAKS